MASGASVQLAQFGNQNKFLTTNPTTTFFKSVYRQHTNFALQPVECTFGGSGSQDLGDENIIDIPPFGDLVKQIYLKVQLPEILLDGAAPANVVPVWANATPEAILEWAELIIGGQVIQRITGEYGFIQSELRTNQALYPALQQTSNRQTTRSDLKTSGIVYMPLYFYFHWHPSLAIPLIALYHQDVKIRVKFRPLNEMIQSYNSVVPADNADIIPYLNTAVMDSIKFTPFVEYVFLDSSERQRFRSGEQLQYLIEQTQVDDIPPALYEGGTTYVHDLHMKQLVKELIFVVQNTSNVATNSDQGNDWFNYENSITNFQVDSCELLFNGETKLGDAVGEVKFFKYLQPMHHHTRVSMNNIYTYSFALRPEEAQPTGAANFSRLRTSQLRLTYAATGVGQTRSTKVYATSMNVFQIHSGLGGLLFS